jgi:general stress protein 26
MNDPGSMIDGVKELEKHTRHIRVAMFTTRSGEGRLISRPLYTKQMEPNGDLWFFSALDSKKVHELVANPQVNLAYADPGAQVFLSIDGRAEIERDPAKIDELWSETTDKLFFKQGRDDPQLVLIRVRAETAEMWTSASTAIGRAFNFLKAKATGDASDLGDQRHIELN